ncbi:hypothetical protein VTJ04DRAFT_8853 [Mycothermus thermophilus]|uniref:uncharacterized protein n=1 Tax=Humicola insolens TaxID=85995 RepID=UPI0037449244
MSQSPPPPPFQTALLAGALAGTTVDLSLFPLDTLKTRLQSASGFFAAGGFRGIYRGVGSALVGSAPGAAFFFCTYEASKSALARSGVLRPSPSDTHSKALLGSELALEHMLAASAGEVAACAVRVPTEVVKQRAQAGLHGGSSWAAFRHILSHRDPGLSGGGLQGTVRGVATVWRELYRGWGITVLREVPFTILQFPLWEALKAWGRERKARTGRGLFGDANIPPPRSQSTSLLSSSPSGQPRREGESTPALAEVSAAESALYGSLAGAVAAGVTTPLDVLKTRVMLSAQRESAWCVVRTILRENGIRPFFSGIGPRVTWISIGGAIFLGTYQLAVNTLTRVEERRRGRGDVL